MQIQQDVATAVKHSFCLAQMGRYFKSSRIRTISRRSRLTTLVVNNCKTLKDPHTIRKE